MIEKVWEHPEVFRIPVLLPENPLRSLNVYVLRDEGESLVIDTGFHRQECRDALLSGLSELGISPSSTRLFLTHLHSDHIGLAEQFVSPKSVIYMSGIDHTYFLNIKKGHVWPYMESLFVRNGFPEDEIALQPTGNQGRRYAPENPFPVQHVSDGDILRVGSCELHCIWTPGHTPGHMALYLPKEKLLFSGDHILFDITPNISVWRDVPASLGDYLWSLEKIKQLDVVYTFPAHRSGSDALYDRINAIESHHRQRLAEVMSLLERHPGSSAFQIAGLMKWSARGTPWEQFPPHQKWFATGEALAHLLFLVQSGQAVVREADETTQFSLSPRLLQSNQGGNNDGCQAGNQ